MMPTGSVLLVGLGSMFWAGGRPEALSKAVDVIIPGIKDYVNRKSIQALGL